MSRIKLKATKTKKSFLQNTRYSIRGSQSSWFNDVMSTLGVPNAVLLWFSNFNGGCMFHPIVRYSAIGLEKMQSKMLFYKLSSISVHFLVNFLFFVHSLHCVDTPLGSGFRRSTITLLTTLNASFVNTSVKSMCSVSSSSSVRTCSSSIFTRFSTEIGWSCKSSNSYASPSLISVNPAVWDSWTMSFLTA